MENQGVLTNRQDHPVYDNQNQRTVGARSGDARELPVSREDQPLRPRAHPERVVHARGAVAHGFFEAYGKIGDEPASKYTRAKLFQNEGEKTPVTIRFSTVIGGRDSAETARDPRGFAVKFRTEDGNWDLVGNNIAVFFIVSGPRRSPSPVFRFHVGSERRIVAPFVPALASVSPAAR